MMRYLIPALLAVLVVVGPAPSVEPEIKEDTILKELRDLRSEIAALRRQREMDAKLNAFDMKLLSERLDRIEKSLESLSAERTGPVRSSFKRTIDDGTGSIRLDNRLPVTAYVTIDGTRYMVEPYSIRILRNQPVGPLNYTVSGAGMGVGPTTRSSLAAGETLTLTIY